MLETLGEGLGTGANNPFRVVTEVPHVTLAYAHGLFDAAARLTVSLTRRKGMLVKVRAAKGKGLGALRGLPLCMATTSLYGHYVWPPSARMLPRSECAAVQRVRVCNRRAITNA